MTVHFIRRIKFATLGLLIAIVGMKICAPSVAVGQAGSFPAIETASTAGNQVIIRAVKELNPQSGAELARALNTMLDLEEYQFARYYLDRLNALNMDDVQRFEIYESLGSGFFLSLHSNDAMQPEGKEFAKQILTAGYSQATSPQRMEQLTSRLTDRDPSVRSTTIRTLRKLGPAATAEIIHRFVDPARETEFPYLRQALRLMGDDAIPPLLGGARASHPQVQAESIVALGSYQSPDVTNVMMRTYLSPTSPESLRTFAIKVLGRNAGVPEDPQFIEERFYEQAKDLLMGRRKLRQGLLGEVTIWQWEAAANRLVPLTVSIDTGARMSAAQIASDLYEIQPASPRNRALYLLTHLESNKRMRGSSIPLDIAAFKGTFDNLDIAELEQALTDALKCELIPAATACCELLGDLGTADLLVSSTQKPRPLVEAILVGDRYLQFAALEAIYKLDPRQAYVGSSFVFSLAVFLASSEGLEAGLVGDNRIDLAQSYSANLALERLAGISATTGQELFSLATQNPDIEVIVITDSLHRPGYLELIQQLRKDMRTKRIPIALLVRNAESHVRLQGFMANDPLFTYLPMSLEPEQIGSQIRRLKALATPWSVDLLDRQHHTKIAIDWLKKVAGDRVQYRFYDMGSRQKELAKILYLPGMAEQGSEILKSLGTPAAQRELLNFVGQSNYPIESRQAAAKAFAETIKTGGALLTREEILRQYHRYNASEREPIETQQLLGSILDALEAQATANRND